MKILHVITSLYTGGAETLVVNLMPRLAALGHEVGLVVFNGEQTPLMDRLEKECPECRIYRLGKSFYNPWYIVKLIRIMQKYDIIHTHNSSPQLFVAIANVFYRKRLVTTEHSTNNRKREKGGFLRLVDRWMYQQYDNVVCISEIAESKLREYLRTGTYNINTIHNGVDVERFHSANPIVELSSNKFVVVMVAGFREAKDQDTLVRAMARLPQKEYELWLVGDGVRRGILENLVNKHNLPGIVKFLGLRSDVPNILKTANMVVMSSHWEGLSLSNIEGMSLGKPFVASDVNGLREVTDGYGILFPHGDDKALAEIIQQLHDDQEYYQQVAHKCYQRAQQFDISKTVEGYNDVYIKLVSNEV